MGELSGKCERCGKLFEYYLIHNGFNESSYAYCDKCGKIAFLNTHSVPDVLKQHFLEYARHKSISEELEKYIEKCSCGGNFKCGTSPRCPHCKQILSPIEANKYIKSDPPNKEGWHWQNNWTDTYAIVIGNNKINDNWKLYPPKLTFKESMKMGLENTRNKPILLVLVSVVMGVVTLTQIRLTNSFARNAVLISLIILIYPFLLWLFVYSPIGRWAEKWFMKSYDDFIKSVEDSKKKHR